MSIPATTPGTLGRVRTPKRPSSDVSPLASALAVTALGPGASAASAGSDESITTKHGSAAFIDRGETLIANDKAKDRFSVMASLTWTDPKTGKGRSTTVRDGNGPGNTPNSTNLRIPRARRCT